MTQNQAILSFLQQGNSITPILALEKFGCFRLGARIYDLKHQGYNIQSKLVEKNKKHFEEYWLPEPPRPEAEEVITRHNLIEETRVNYKAVGKQMVLII